MKALFSKAEKAFPSSRFARNVSVLVGGTATGQLIVIAASPILTRLYSPEDFGLLAVYAALLSILGVIACLRYQLAIPLPESDKEAASIAILSLASVAAFTVLSGFIIWLFDSQIVELLNTPDLASYLWMVPVGVFMLGVYQVFQHWAIRRKEFSSIARTRLAQSSGMVFTQIFGYTLGPLALLLGRMVGQSAGVWGLAKSALARNRADFKASTSKEIRNVARKYKKFPLVSMWTGLSSAGGSNLPPILIAAFLGAGSAGIFALAHRVLSQPMAIVGRAVGDVFYRQAAEAYRNGTLDSVVVRVYEVLVKVALPPALVGFILIPDVFTFLFGEGWHKAGEVARWMIPWLFFQLVVSPSTRIYPILGLHGVALRFQLSFLCSTIVSALVGGLYFESLVATVVLMSSINSLVYLWRVFYTFRLVGLKKRKAADALLEATFVSLLCCLPITASTFIYGSVFGVGLLGFCAAIASFASSIFYGFFVLKKVLV